MENETKQEFTSKENRIVLAANLLLMSYMIIPTAYTFVSNCVDRVGGQILYIFTALSLLLIIDAVAFTVLFFTSLRRIKKFRKRYCAAAVFLVAMAAFFGYFSYDYAADIFGGTETVTTNEYVIPRVKNAYISFIDKNGKDVTVSLNDEIVEKLNSNQIVEDNPWSENALVYHENTITIEYYPNSSVLSSAMIN